MKPRKGSQVQEMLAAANRHKVNYHRASTLKAITSDPATGLQDPGSSSLLLQKIDGSGVALPYLTSSR